MKSTRTLAILALLFLFPITTLAIDNVKLNGQSEISISSVPADVTLTADLDAAGDRVSIAVVADWNQNGVFDETDRLNGTWRWIRVTDGIGTLEDPQDPTRSIPGDESGVDGSIQVHVRLFRDMLIRFPAGKVFVEVTGDSGVSEIATVTLSIPQSPPILTGKITDAATGAPLRSVAVLAMKFNEEREMVMGVADSSDVNGDYSMMLTPGSWLIEVSALVGQPHYVTLDTFSVSIGADEIKQQDINLTKYQAFLEGTITNEDGTPAEGVVVSAQLVENWRKRNLAATDATGFYSMGLPEGEHDIFVWGGFRLGGDWVDQTWLDPVSPEVFNSVNGSTHTQDFVVRPYKAFVGGICTVDGVPVPNVNVVVTVEIADNEYAFNNGQTDEEGRYLLGVLPGALNYLPIDSWQFRVDTPVKGFYNEMTIAEGDSLTDLDFELRVHNELGSVAGLVSDDLGVGIPDAVVVAVRLIPTQEDDFLLTTTSADGSFIFENMAGGTWRIAAAAPGMESTPMQFIDPLVGVATTGVDFTIAETIVSTEDLPVVFEFQLDQSFPNPATEKTRLSFSIPETDHVELTLYDIIGREILPIVSTEYQAGPHTLQIDVDHLPAGVYFYRLTAGEHAATRKLVVR